LPQDPRKELKMKTRRFAVALALVTFVGTAAGSATPLSFPGKSPRTRDDTLSFPRMRARKKPA